jgi:putative endonuclease
VGRHVAGEPQNLGRYGEDLACRELKRRGYRIIERRARCRLGEIDIVAWDGPVLVFIEVKARRGDRFGSPFEAVDWRKQKKIIKLAQMYTARRRLHSVEVRFDIVGVELDSYRKPRVELIQGAFEDQ